MKSRSKNRRKRGGRIRIQNTNTCSSSMSLVCYSILRSCRNYFFNGCRACSSTKYCNDSFLGYSLKFVRPSLVQSFVTCRILFRGNEELSLVEEGTEIKGSSLKKQKKPQKVSVILNNEELVMEMVAAQKFAKRKNMNLEPVEGARKDKKKYRLVNETKKSQSKDAKKTLLIRPEIGSHDLETKINQISKFLNKGLQVICKLESEYGKQKWDGVLDEFEKSKIKEYLHKKISTSRGFHLHYKPVAGKTDNKTKGSSVEPSE